MNIIILTLLSTIFCFLIIVKIGKIKNLYDLPLGHKTHTVKAQFTGGLAIQLSLFFYLKLFDFNHYFQSIIVISAILTIAGILDDTKKINIGSKFLCQLFVSFLLFYNGFKISDIGYYSYFGLIELNSFAPVFTIISILVIINGVNYIDGQDGLATSLFLNSLFLISIFKGANFKFSTFEINLIILYSIFLIFNFKIFDRLDKVFLGNSGSMITGLILSGLAIFYSSIEKNVHPSLIIWCFNIIVYEFLSVNLYRFFKKKSILKPGKDHIHFFLKKKIKSEFKILIILNLINIFMGILGYMLFNILGAIVCLLSYIFMFLIYFSLRQNLITKN